MLDFERNKDYIYIYVNREHKIFLGCGTVFKRDIHLKEQRQECWIGRRAKTLNKQGI